MRSVLVTALLAATVVVGTGCTADTSNTPGNTPGNNTGNDPGSDPAAAAPQNPAIAPACGAARKVIIDSTTRSTAAVNRVMAARDAGDAGAEQAGMQEIRTTFADWSTVLRSQSEATTEAELKAVLLEYAGAVSAVISRVKTVDDLEKITSFEDTELDIAAGKFENLCK